MSKDDKLPIREVPSHALLYFFLLTFAITWGIAGAYIFFPIQATGLFGELEGAHPLYFIATWGPGLAGFILVLFYGGSGGLSRFLSRLFLWRCHPLWWALVLVGLPLGFMTGSLIKGGPLIAPMEDGAGQFFVLSIIMLLLGPVEEFGWRGVAQPILQRHVAPIWAGAIIGVVWGVWHIPAFYLSGTVYADWNLPLFLVGCITLAVLVTPIFNASGGGLLLPVLFHWQLIIPFWPDAQPWDTWIFVAVTAVVIWLNRTHMVSSTGAETTVIPD
ncbi:MAG: CPBP family glutamic-type intramembrane protease [Yoonia sp.]|uniref:CPBP family glutamic-type intramembrane protease n=1 Tax=Yoonia sp. TaxID=2212373 RepID=UPI003EF13DD2